jgi:hypothetical protein
VTAVACLCCFIHFRISLLLLDGLRWILRKLAGTSLGCKLSYFSCERFCSPCFTLSLKLFSGFLPAAVVMKSEGLLKVSFNSCFVQFSFLQLHFCRADARRSTQGNASTLHRSCEKEYPKLMVFIPFIIMPSP